MTFLAVAVVLAIYIVIDILADELSLLNSIETHVLAVGAITVLGLPVLIPLFVSQDDTNEFSKSKTRSIEEGQPPRKIDVEVGEEIRKTQRESGNVHSVVEVPPLARKIDPLEGAEAALLRSVHSQEFWLLFISIVAGVGTAFTLNDNLTELGEALGYSSTTAASAFLNVWNFFGRMGGGFASEYLLR